MIRKLGTGLGFALVLLFLVEGAAWLLLSLGSGPASGFLVSRGGEFHRRLAKGFVGTSRGPLAVDPHLGYALEPAFQVLGDGEGEGALRIVALGGSTTDPFNQGHWSGTLSEILVSEGIPARIYNGGVGSYSTNQEVIKLIRDALALNPQVVISVDGVNDLGLVKSISASTPMVNHPQQAIMDYVVGTPAQSLFLPNLARLLRFGEGILQKPHWGHPDEMKAEEVWEKNVRIMNAVSEEFGIRYLAVLQPIMGFGSYDPSPREQEMWEERQQRLRPGETPYHVALTRYYEAAQVRCAQIPYCADLTEIYAGKSDLYGDPRHPNPEGYRLLGEAIFRELRDRGLLAVPQNPESDPQGAAGEVGREPWGAG
jgi:lysophospholipase L1-like esterase